LCNLAWSWEDKDGGEMIALRWASGKFIMRIGGDKRRFWPIIMSPRRLVLVVFRRFRTSIMLEFVK
jgi:hypothetical protein